MPAFAPVERPLELEEWVAAVGVGDVATSLFTAVGAGLELEGFGEGGGGGRAVLFGSRRLYY